MIRFPGRTLAWNAGRSVDATTNGNDAASANSVGHSTAQMSAMNTAATKLTVAEQKSLLEIARQALLEFVRSGGQPRVDESNLTPALREPRSCFVTLTRQGQLRGCIGNIQPREPLFRAVMNNACGAAFRDSRFSPVDGKEIPELEIEISVLTEPTPLTFASPQELLPKLRPDVDGVVLKAEGRTATFLPQVWKKIPDAADFMDELARKALLPTSAWRGPDTVVLTYQVESFEDARPGG